MMMLIYRPALASWWDYVMAAYIENEEELRGDIIDIGLWME